MSAEPKNSEGEPQSHDGRAISPNELLTTDEVIDRLLEDANLRRVAATCVLPAVRVGSTWRFRRRDLDEWIRRQMVNEEG